MFYSIFRKNSLGFACILNTWGGRRPNSGRKKVGDAVLYCRMPQKAVNEIKTAAKEQNLAVGDYLIKQLGL